VPIANVNGVRLFYERTGDAGPSLVLAHGSWGDHGGWKPVVSSLAQRFRVVVYDRRGHGRSEPSSAPGSIEDDAADLAGLIEYLGFAPAHVAGISFGGSIALRLAARRPELFRSLAAQEPPLFGLLANDPVHGPAMREVLDRIEAVAERLAAGDAEGGTRRFFETVAHAPGVWDGMPLEVRRFLIGHAATFLEEALDPESYTVDLAALAGFTRPVLLSHGDTSPPWFAPVVAKLAAVLPHAETRVFVGAGHVAIDTHAAEYVAAVTALAAAVDRPRRNLVPPMQNPEPNPLSVKGAARHD
jgi:pimeloyl-ACP methyl ester carboxylesterase